MADVTHETTPPGSWPKGKSVDEASDAAPRSSPAIHKGEHGDTGDQHSEQDQHEHNYTVSKGDVKKPATKDLDEPNGLKDDVANQEPNGLKEVDAEPIPEDAEKQADNVQDQANKAELPERSLGAKAAMASKAKDAFDAVSSKKDEAGKATDKATEETVPEATEEADKAVPKEDPTEKTKDLDEGVKETSGEATEGVEATTEDAKKTAEGVEAPTDEVKETAEGVEAPTEDVKETAEGVEAPTDEAKAVGDEVKDTADETEGKVGDTAAEAEEAAEEKVDLSLLKGAKVNKGGNLVDDSNKVVGRVTEGALAHLVGKRCDENGDIWDASGKKVGKAELIPENEKDAMLKEAGPFESFPDAVVDGKGMVVSNGETIGKVIEGDHKTLRGKSVDADGDILDRGGNVIGKAERWEAEPEAEPEPEAEVDRSILAGKRVNKAGNVVDSSGTIFGRVIEGNAKNMVGRMCDKKGNILSESGDVIGKAEVVPEGEREGLKEGPFAELSGCTVTKDGKVVTPGGDVVGRLVKGDGKTLFGRAVDEDGDVCDKNGNVLGKAERWEEPEVEKKKNSMAGRRVNREGNVVDEDGNLVGKLTSGELSICSGKEIDDDGDVVDGKGTTIGHVSLLQDIPEPVAEPSESAEEKETRETIERDRKLAAQMAGCVEQCLDKIKPICDMITDKIERAERTPKEELDEEELVKQVKPLLEEGGKILNEANGIIRGLDPDGRIQANAKHKTATREATPEEYRLADILKELTGTVTKTIENGKKKIEGMPHAKKELNPLWGLLNEPLFQILAAVGLLLNGVLSLVGRLLSGLGLGGLLDGLLGTLGLNRVLEGLGLGSVTGALTGGKDKKKKSGGLLGLGG